MLQLILGLVFLGVVLWAVEQLPMDPTVATVVRIVIVVCMAIYVINFLTGMVPGFWPRWMLQ